MGVWSYHVRAKRTSPCRRHVHVCEDAEDSPIISQGLLANSQQDQSVVTALTEHFATQLRFACT
jgi:hypothetical protein